MTAQKDYVQMQDVLMRELRLMHYPIAVKFFFDEVEIAAFQAGVEEFFTPAKPTSFCQWEIAARMQGQTVLADAHSLGCANAAFVFGWKALDAAEIRSHEKYARDRAQAERFIQTKSRLPEGKLRAIALAPLADTYFPPDTVHFYVDNMQAYHLAVDYMAALDIHPLRPAVTMNSSACGGNVFTFLEKTFNLLPACSGSYNAGKTERGETNVMIPGEHIGLVVDRLLERQQIHHGASVTRPGDPFPGADICKNCPLIAFKKGKPR